MAVGALTEIVQDDFSAGLIRRGPREAIPRNGAYDLTNVYLDETGRPNRRGGSAYKTAALGSGARLYSLFDGYFSVAGGFRTVFTADTSKLYVLASDDSTVVQVANWTGSKLHRPVMVGSDLVLPQTASDVRLYAGSRKTANYTVGTASMTLGSRVVTGSGTGWSANVDPGMFFQATGQVYEVTSVGSNTQLTLDRAWAETTGSASYTLSPDYTATLSNTQITASMPKLAAVANRLAYTAGNQVGFSDINDEFTYSSGSYLEFPGQVVGLATTRQTLLVFTSGGMYAVSGLASNSPASVTGDPQWRRELVNRELIAWAHEGIAEWQGGAIVPCLDGVWSVDALSGPRFLSQAISDLYLSYVRTSGYKTGVAAIIGGHYLLPILNSSDQWVDLLDLKLSTGAWVHHSGAGAKMALLAARKSSPPLLLGGTEASGVGSTATRVYTLPYYQPSTSVKSDHDGTSHQASVTTGDYSPTGQPSRFKRLRVWQEGTVDSGSPTLAVTAQRPSDGSAQTLSGGTSDATTQSALSDASSYSWWSKNGSGGQGALRGNRIRYTITTAGALSTWILHRIVAYFQPTGRQ